MFDIYVCLGDVNMWARVILESYEYWFFTNNNNFIVCRNVVNDI